MPPARSTCCIAFLASTLALSGCDGRHSRSDNVIGGVMAGAAAGGVIGAVCCTPSGAPAGILIGGIAGGTVGFFLPTNEPAQAY